MHSRAAEVFVGNVLASDGSDHVGSGDVHLPYRLDHEDEVGHCGRVDRATCRRTGDDGDLRDNARCERVASEDFAVTRQRVDALLNARPAGVVDAHDGRANFDGVIHHLGYFLRGDLGERSAEHREVLGVGEYGSTFDLSPSGYYRVAFEALFVESEVGGTVGVEGVDLGEATVVEQLCQAFAGSEFAAFLLRFDAPFAAAKFSRRAT